MRLIKPHSQGGFICRRCISPRECFFLLLFFSFKTFKTIENSNRQIRRLCADAANEFIRLVSLINSYVAFSFFHFFYDNVFAIRCMSTREITVYITCRTVSNFLVLCFTCFTSFSGHRPAQREWARTGLGSHARCHPYPIPQPVKVDHTTGLYVPYYFRTVVWVLLRPTRTNHWKFCETGSTVFRPYPRRLESHLQM